MSTIVVSFRPLARDRYQPRVWRGEYKEKAGRRPARYKVWEVHKPIKRSQLDSFRNRITARRRNARVVNPPQKPTYWRDYTGKHLKITCRCGAAIPIRNDTQRATCPRCDAVTPVSHDYL